MSPSDRMTIDQVSKYIGVGVNTLQRRGWRAKNKFPLAKIGRDLVSYRPMIDKWIEDKLSGRN